MSEAALNYVEPEEDYEIIEGVKYMAPAASPNHGTIINRLFLAFAKYADEHPNSIGVFTDNIEIRLDKNNVIRPDLSVVCNPLIVQIDKALFGVPDLAVEVLSPSTAKRDRGAKMNIYESNGTREYWIVEPILKTIEVYHLIDGRFELDEVYRDYTSEALEELDDEERAAVKTEIKVSIVPDLTINVKNIFRWWWGN